MFQGIEEEDEFYWFFPNCVKLSAKEFYSKLKHSNLYVVNYEQNLLKINFSWSSNGKSTEKYFFKREKNFWRKKKKSWNTAIFINNR